MDRALPTTPPIFADVDEVIDRLAETGYLADKATATAVFLADRLGKPLLIEGPAGVGKTELARAVAQTSGAELVRLQCYEGVDESRALYEWNHAKQILRIQAGTDHSWDATKQDVFSEEFLLPRPLLTAIRREDPTVLLVDEFDKADVEIEGLLLEVLSDFAVTVPELGTISATRKPFTVLTSNATRELSEALKRRCLFLHLDFPDADLERRILASRVPELPEAVAEQLVRTVRVLRGMQLKKLPSVAETID
ncbi:MAG: MoxR family ATPase, partial [Rhodococcus sp. (in: high G+C Gram-positive bacteria)]|nr:MoxR family ATPase [Rhodococcus sp. (in: high G+C Gram-positive bacteria)]MDX5453063.1 MoxR family ATPase [Rhodococcus sp. (in: high G+C Gram-positive bacteria)]